MIFKDHASNYYNYGIGVIPMKIKSKGSFVGYRYFNDSNSIPTEENYAAWEKNFPHANISILCGIRSGITLLDIDTNDKDILKWCPKSPLVKKGSKGETRVFKSNNEPTLHFKNPDIDILGNKSITFAPPSIHYKTGKPYIWSRKDLWFDNLDDFPTLSKEFLQELAYRAGRSIQQGVSELTPSDGSRCNHGSHMKINSMINAALHDGDSFQDILNSILEFDEKNNPTVSYFLCPSRPEFNSKNRAINAMQCITSVAKGLHNKGEIKEVNTAHEPIINIVEKTEDDNYKKKSLPHLRGFGDLIFKDIYKNSYVPRSRFAAAATLSIISVVLGNRCHLGGTLPNIYNMIVAPSGYGKDFPLGYVTRLFSKAGMANVLNSEPSSDSALISLFPKNRVQIFTIKEAASMFRSMTKQVSSHTLKLGDTLANIFTSSGKDFDGKLRQKDIDDGKGKALGRCFSPYCVVNASMTLSSFQDCMTLDLLNAGVGGRIFYFVDTEFKDFVIPLNKGLIKINPTVLKIIKKYKFENIAVSPESEFEIPALDVSTEAEETIMEIQKEFIQDRRTALLEHSAVANRKYELFLKLVQIDTACVNMPNPIDTWVVSKDSAQWAYSFYKAQYEDVKKLITENVHSNDESRCLQEFEDIIKSAGSSGIKRTDLFLKTRKTHLISKGRDYIIKILLEENTIFQQKMKDSNSKGGPKPITYFHKKFIKKS